MDDVIPLRNVKGPLYIHAVRSAPQPTVVQVFIDSDEEEGKFLYMRSAEIVMRRVRLFDKVSPDAGINLTVPQAKALRDALTAAIGAVVE